MSKKSTRRKMPKERAAAPRTGAGMTANVPVATPVMSKTVEFKPDYSYVIKDLRRIGLLAGTFIAILVVLSFFLR